MKDPKVLYILISLFCVFAIVAGIYAQFIDPNYGGLNFAQVDNPDVVPGQTQEELRDRFNNLFTNTLNLNGFDTTGLQRIDNSEEIIFTYNFENITDRYELRMNIPAFNIKSELANLINQQTQANFINKANTKMQDDTSTVMTLYNIDYTANINENILSLVIRATLKEGSTAQRTMVQTYNYNLETNEQVSLVDLITFKMLNAEEVNNTIMQVVTKANEEAETFQNMGYNDIFIRDLTSNIYNVNNASSYFLGPNGELYIVYAYGNDNLTSEVDIILFE